MYGIQQPNLTLNGERIFAIFIDVCTKYAWRYAIKKKSDVIGVFMKFQKMVERKF